MIDSVVIGAGPVGATFAALMQSQGRTVVVLEARSGKSTEQRTLALSHGSAVILGDAGARRALGDAAQIHRIHTSQRGAFGRAVIDRSDANVSALGYVVSYASLQAALDDALATTAVEVLRGASVTAIEEREESVAVSFAYNGEPRMIEAASVVLADGGANLHRVPALTTQAKDYGQVALLGHVVLDRPHGNVAYERFTDEGPAALLPLTDPRHCSFVWVSSPERISELLALSEDACRDAFQAHFGLRAGRFISLSARKSFPLSLRTVVPRAVGRVAVIGNAAQALHPVAGQGFNLGLRDARALANCLSGAGRANDAKMALAHYASQRDADVDRSVGFTDFLVSAFVGSSSAIKGARGLGLLALDALPAGRKLLAQRMLFGARP